ncbi:hypothetical protein Pcinc_044339 [Petrolisthes cinctipes]|uniref:Uncharacterized protein n=1 Tax=Petrolisthes cinctipes TaxID=88211 RepID=A0AAE1BF34_PETCI|nr:hypothetical protein Pcinc_044339 [Petrolisthes cinctipes]
MIISVSIKTQGRRHFFMHPKVKRVEAGLSQFTSTSLLQLFQASPIMSTPLLQLFQASPFTSTPLLQTFQVITNHNFLTALPVLTNRKFFTTRAA